MEAIEASVIAKAVLNRYVLILSLTAVPFAELSGSGECGSRPAGTDQRRRRGLLVSQPLLRFLIRCEGAELEVGVKRADRLFNTSISMVATTESG